MNPWICDCRRCAHTRLAQRVTYVLGVVLAIAVGVLALGLLTGCYQAAPSGNAYAEPTDEPQTALETCVVGRPVCVQAVYCDERSAEEWEQCGGVADLSCKLFPVATGIECFDGVIGHCDGKGVCE
jgi:hypothetical protein